MVETICQLFLKKVKPYPKKDLMLYKKEGHYVPISTNDFLNWIKYFSLGMKDMGFNARDKLIILSENRPEWIMTDLANLCLGGITVPVYTSLSSEQIKYIIDDSDAKAVVCSNQELWQKIKAVKEELTKVEHYISFEYMAPAGVLASTDIMERGKKRDQEEPELFEKMALEVKADDIATIIYTSGTTGVPKGVLLTHYNLMRNIEIVSSILNFTNKDTALSFLPLSHIFERVGTFIYLYNGCSIGYAENVETVPENLLELRPTIMLSVPRIFEKIYSKVMDNILSSPKMKKQIFFWALKTGKEYSEKEMLSCPLPRFLSFKRNLAKKLVFSKITKRTGGRIKFFVSGGAPLSKDIAEFFFSIGLIILEGYGLTETSPVISINTFKDMKLGTVGKPIQDIEVRIAQDGEILTRGHHVMKGYYKKEAETKESIEGGWFHTGDIGYLDEEGFLTIKDRKKDILITAGGKNIAPQPIENQIKTNSYISNAVVIGDRRNFVSALIVPNFEKLEEYARSKNILSENRKDLVKNEYILNFMLKEVERSTPSLASYEKVKKIVLLDREFKVEEGEITPTLKVRRKLINDKYRDLINSIYQEKN